MLRKQKNIQYQPFSGDTFQGPQWMSETIDTLLILVYSYLQSLIYKLGTVRDF
jgi:hypothetical protein